MNYTSFTTVAKLHFDINYIANGCGIDNLISLKEVFTEGSGTYKLYQLKLSQQLGFDIMPGFGLFDFQTKIEYGVRMMHQKGAILCKSISIGGKRKFDEHTFLNYINGIEGMFIIDTDTYPHVNVEYINKYNILDMYLDHKLNKNGFLTRKMYYDLKNNR